MPRRAVPLLATVLVSAALAENADRPTSQQLATIEGVKGRVLWKLEQHNLDVNSKRKTTPVLRPENISDDEVRELVQLTHKFVPGAIVNISAVTRGCPCEDGAACTDSVSVLAISPTKSTIGLPFRRIKDRWVVATLTQWYWDLDTMAARRGEFPSTAAYGQAWDTLLDRFPYCQEPAATPTRRAP